MSVYKDEHIFKSLNEYMFTTKNISRLHDNVFISQSPQKISNTLEQLCKKKKTVPNNVGDAQVEDLYYPKQHDKLFWSFYIFLHGKIEYDYTTHIFETEKKYKIQSVEKLRDMKALLRQHKLKYADIEKELVSLPKITIKGLHALCILYKVSITYVSGNIYYILPIKSNNNDDTFKLTETEAGTAIDLKTEGNTTQTFTYISDSLEDRMLTYFNKELLCKQLKLYLLTNEKKMDYRREFLKNIETRNSHYSVWNQSMNSFNS